MDMLFYLTGMAVWGMILVVTFIAILAMISTFSIKHAGRRKEEYPDKKAVYNRIIEWNHNKNLKTFMNLYLNNFNYAHWYWRPIFRIFCIIKYTINNTYVKIEEKYVDIYKEI